MSSQVNRGNKVLTVARNLPSSLRPHLAECAETNDPDAIFVAIWDAVRLAGAIDGIFLFVDDTRTKLIAWARCGDPDVRSPQLAVALNEKLGQVLLATQHSDTVTDDKISLFLMRELSLRECEKPRCVWFPIRQGDQPLAVMLLEFDRQSCSDSYSNPLLLTIASLTVQLVRLASEMGSLNRQMGGLSTLVAMHESVSKAPNFEEVLAIVLEHVGRLTAAEQAGVMLYDPDGDELVMQKPALGVSEERVKRLRAPLKADGISSHVFMTGEPYLCHDLKTDPGVLIHVEGERDSIAVPLSVAGRRIGIFFVSNKRNGAFSEKDVQLVSLLTSHLGTLIENAQLLVSERQASTNLQKLNRIIEEQREGLRRTLTVHDELSRMVLDGHGISAIIAHLGRLFANPIVVEDRFGSLIGCDTPHSSADITQRHASDLGGLVRLSNHPQIRALLARVGQDRRAQRLMPIPELGVMESRVIAPVLVGREIMAYVYVPEKNRDLDELDFSALEGAAIAIALQMMKEKAEAEAQYKLRGDIVTELLAGNVDEMLTSRARHLGIDLNTMRAVLVITVDDYSPLSAPGSPENRIGLEGRVLDTIIRALRRREPNAVALAKRDEIVVLSGPLQTNGDDNHIMLHDLGDYLRAEVRKWLSETCISVGIGNPCQALDGYRKSYEQAHCALDVVKSAGKSDRTLAFEEVGICGLIFAPQNRDRLHSLVEDALGNLLEYDRRNSTELTETLEQYLQHGAHLRQTAAAMDVHYNTLRFRLQRIEQVSGSDLGNPETRLNVQLALKAWSLLNSEKAFKHSGSLPLRKPLPLYAHANVLP